MLFPNLTAIQPSLWALHCVIADANWQLVCLVMLVMGYVLGGELVIRVVLP